MTILHDEHIDRTAWQQLALHSPITSWFQTPEAYDFYALLTDQMRPFAISVCDEKNLLRGVVVGYITRAASSFRNHFTSRAIIYGGPLLSEDIAHEELSALLSALIELLRQKTIFIETRNFSDYAPYRAVFESCGFTYQPHYDAHLHLQSIDEMWQNLHESKQRYLRKTTDYRCTATTDEADISQFYSALEHLYKTKVHRPLPPVSFIRQLLQTSVGKLLIVKTGEQFLGGMLCVAWKEILYEWYVVGPAIVTWAAMCYGAENGYKLFDFMGAGEPNKPYGVRDFKVQMGGKLHEYGRYLYVCDKTRYTLGCAGVKLLS